MKPQKRSIRDFFSPVSRSSQESTRGTSQLQDASTIRASPLSLSRTPSVQQDLASPTINARAAPTVPNTSTSPSAPTSISATSADAQPPTTSQASANSGASKRIVSNGEQVVLNSDSDTDSLPDLDWGQPATSVKTVTPTTHSKRTTENDEDGLRKPEKKRGSEKRPFDQVLETAQKNKKIEQQIIEHKADLEKGDVDDVPVTEFVLNEDALGKAIEDDEDSDKAHRLFLAMQRTNATQEDSVFHFFDDTTDSIAVRSRFPVHALPEYRWTSSFRDASARDQAFLTGFAHQVFRLQELPKELASWMIDQVCLDPSEALDSKYLEVLEAHHQHLHTLLDRNRLDAIFRMIGGKVKCLSSDAHLTPSFDAHSGSSPPLPHSLKSTARLLGRAAPWLRTKARTHALYILCHVCMDDRVFTDMDALEVVQDAIEAIVCNFTDNQKLTQGVGSSLLTDEIQSLIASQLSDVLLQLLSRVTHPGLQRILVRALPAKSPLTAYFQRHLALSFLLHPVMIGSPTADLQVPTLIHKHLDTSPNFRINKKTNYGFLAARMTLLDIAIGPGLSPVPYQPLVSPVPSQAGSSPIMAPFPASSEVKEFNRGVDALAQHIKMLGNSIVEAGAVVDLTILEAKDSIERLCSRLEHAVRIGGKKHHDVFFNDDDEERQLRVTDIFRKAAEARKAAPPGGGIFDNDEDEDVDVTDDEAAAAQLKAELAT